MTDPANSLVVSVASFWELAIKNGRGRPTFQIDLARLRSGLRLAGYQELQISSDHALAVQSLPDIHRDPFDRLLVAQALVENITLLTADRDLATYPALIRRV